MAAEARTRLDFSYSDAEGAVSRRVVRPLGLWFWGKVWTLIGWCELRRDFRMFRLDRMDDLTIGTVFKAEPDKTLSAFYARELARGNIPHDRD